MDYLQGNLIAAASIEPPWQKVAGAAFEMAENLEAASISPNSIQRIVIEPEAPEPAAAITVETVETVAEDFGVVEIQMSEIAVQLDETAFSEELDFTDIDASISALKETMARLREASSFADANADETRDAA